MDTRVATIGIIVDEQAPTDVLNDILHEFRMYIVGRMGIPYRQKGVNVICLVVDAPQDDINTMTGRLGKLQGISAKACYSQV